MEWIWTVSGKPSWNALWMCVCVRTFPCCCFLCSQRAENLPLSFCQASVPAKGFTQRPRAPFCLPRWERKVLLGKINENLQNCCQTPCRPCFFWPASQGMPKAELVSIPPEQREGDWILSRIGGGTKGAKTNTTITTTATTYLGHYLAH